MGPTHLVRVVAFAMRAMLAKVESAGENLNLVLAQQIIYGAGFFGLLYSAYLLVLDRYDHRITSGSTTLTIHRLNRGVIKGTTGTWFLPRITGNRILIHLALIAAVSFSITGAVNANTGSTQKTITLGKNLKTVSVVMFLVIAGLLVVHTLLSIVAESRKTSSKQIPGKWLTRVRR